LRTWKPDEASPAPRLLAGRATPLHANFGVGSAVLVGFAGLLVGGASGRRRWLTVVLGVGNVLAVATCPSAADAARARPYAFERITAGIPVVAVTLPAGFDANPRDHLSLGALDLILWSRLVYLELGPADAPIGLKSCLGRADRVGVQIAGH
jgi:hypothetical protein